MRYSLVQVVAVALMQARVEAVDPSTLLHRLHFLPIVNFLFKLAQVELVAYGDQMLLALSLQLVADKPQFRMEHQHLLLLVVLDQLQFVAHPQLLAV
jgi:hypothetical protein